MIYNNRLRICNQKIEFATKIVDFVNKIVEFATKRVEFATKIKYGVVAEKIATRRATKLSPGWGSTVL